MQKRKGNKVKRKNIALMVGLLAFMLVVSACSDSTDNNSDEDGDITLEFWTMQLEPTFTEYLEDLIAEYEEANPNVEIDWLDVPADDLEQKVLSDVSAGNAPDVVNLNPSFGSSLAELDATTNVEEFVEDEEKEKYIQGAWEANQLGEETFGIPWYLDTDVTFNNPDIYEEAGLDIEDPPETYKESLEYAKVVKEETGKYGYFPSLDLSLPLQYMEKMDVPLMNDDGTAAFNTDDGVEVIELFKEFYDEKLIPKESLSGDQREGTDFYQAEEVAFGGDFFIADVKENAPEVYDKTVPSRAITGDSGKLTMTVQNLVVPEQSEHQEAAIDFALFVTNADNQVEFSKLSPVLPSVEEALDDPYFTEEPEDAETTDQMRIISAEQLTDAEVLVPPMENQSDLETVMHDAFARAMLGKQSAEESLDQAEEEWNEVVAE